METSLYSALFLDRDGVIIENRDNYVRAWEDVAFIPGALAALTQIRNSPYKIVIVTNQSAIGRGIITRQTAEEINTRVVQEIEAAGGRVDAVFMCPHTPDEHCSCRKPQPGLLLQAAEALSLDLSRSILIGDAVSDIQAGQAAGLLHTVLVCTGRGASQSQLPAAQHLQPFIQFENLQAAVQALILNA